jgi:hypothetical protein
MYVNRTNSHVHVDTIYVRAFEHRMDTLQVATLGTSGTPYHDGLSSEYFYKLFIVQKMFCVLKF